MPLDRKEFISGLAAVAVGGRLSPAAGDAAREDTRPPAAAKTGGSSFSSTASIRGRVTSGGMPLAKVTVSDGLQCVKTDKNGRFALPKRDGAKFVTVCPPCGYKMKDWYRLIDAAAATYDFALEKTSVGKPKCGCRFVHITDSEISDTGSENKK